MRDKEPGLPNRTEGGEALLVRLAKELEIKPRAFLSVEKKLQRLSTLGMLAAMSISMTDFPSPELEAKMRRIWIAGLDSGILSPSDKKDIFG